MFAAAMPSAATNFIFKQNVLRGAKRNSVFKRNFAPSDVYFSVKIVVSLRRTPIANVSVPHSFDIAALS